ncbi:FBF1 factor, partial [Syrrhaptes paradoxus]|nr:FBF1 factor [Syrrhaptes paradoxus]
RSFPEDDLFSKLPAEDITAAEGSSTSEADPQALLQALKDMDDIEADLLGVSKHGSGPGKTTGKGPGKGESLEGGVKTAGKLLTPEKGKRRLCSFFHSLIDPLAGLLASEEQGAPEMPAPTGAKSSPEKTAEWSKEKEPPPSQPQLHTVALVRRKGELMFEDGGDDWMDALGFGNGLKGDEKRGKKAEEEELRPAGTKLEKLQGRGSMAQILEQPDTGERREFKLDKKHQKQPGKEEGWDEEDFVFGASQPRVASVPAGQMLRRSSVSRFLAENSSEWHLQPHSKPPPAVSRSPLQGSRARGDWLSWKDEGVIDAELPSPAKASPTVSFPSPAAARQPGPASRLPAPEEAAARRDMQEEEDWLSALLSRKKAQVKARESNAEPSEAPGEGLDPCSPVSQPAASAGAPQQAAALQDTAASTDGCRRPVPWLSTPKPASARPSEAAKGDPCRDASALVPTALFPSEQEMQGPAPLAQVGLLGLDLLSPSPQAESPALGLLQERRLGAATAPLGEDASGCRALLLSAQARVAELESQVRTLELERTQHKLLLESLQKRHQDDLDLLESSARSQVKLVEETYRQREEWLRQDKEQLVARLLSQSQDAEQSRAELLAQHQQRLATLEQQNALELERLRELHRVSVQEMHKDHEDQLQRLKQLKDWEVEAVTSAFSPIRSLSGVTGQLEKFCGDLHELSHRVEAVHRTTAEELATGARQRDQQLQMLQDRLSQQQRDMEEERSRFQEVMATMEARLDKQTRLLEQERWKATAEQSKAESLQRSLEEERQMLTQQLSVQRAELERAKSALLEEQKSVMQKCSEEQRKLMAEWAELHTQQRLRKERIEGDMDRTLQRDSQREGSILSLAKEQAELKSRSHALEAQKEQLVRDRELLDEAWQELRLEKEKVKGAMLRVQQQQEEVKSMMEVSEASALQFTAVRRPAAKPECAQAAEQLQVMQQPLEQQKQQEQHLHQANTPSPSLLGLGLPCQGSAPLLTASLSPFLPGTGQECLGMAHQRRQLQQLRQELPSNATALLTAEQDLSAPTRGLSSTLCSPPPGRVLPRHSPGGRTETLAAAGSAGLHATLLLLLTHWAQQDHDFLEEEQFFLESLKKAPYNTSSWSG